MLDHVTMLIANTTSEHLPLGIAVAVNALFIGLGVYLLLTGFHSAWRRPVHWGRMKRGPVLSKWSHAVVGIWALSAPFSLTGKAYGFRDMIETACGPIAGFISAVMIGCLIYDCVIHYRRPRDLTIPRSKHPHSP